MNVRRRQAVASPRLSHQTFVNPIEHENGPGLGRVAAGIVAHFLHHFDHNDTPQTSSPQEEER